MANRDFGIVLGLGFDDPLVTTVEVSVIGVHLLFRRRLVGRDRPNPTRA